MGFEDGSWDRSIRGMSRTHFKGEKDGCVKEMVVLLWSR